MIRNQLHDYIFTGKHISLSETKRNGTPLLLGDLALFPLCFQLTIILRGILGYKFELIRDTILFLGFFFIWVSQIKHTVKLDKMYYLCPMDSDERVAYLKNALIFRGCLHSIVVAITCLLLYFFCRVNAFAILYILLDGLLFSFLNNVRDNKKDFIRAAFLKPAMFLSAYLQFALPSSGFEKDDLFFIICSFAFLLLVELPMFVSVNKAVRNDIVSIASCEEDLYRC